MTDVGKYVPAGEEALLMRLCRVLHDAAAKAHSVVLPNETSYGPFERIHPTRLAIYRAATKAVYHEIVKLSK